jgi:flagellar assembly factor FliW
MPVVETDNFGRVEYEAGAEMVFPRGLPGFENARAFVALHRPETDPLIFLQSLEERSLCFVTVPIRVVAPEYRLEMEREDVAVAGLASPRPRIGEDVMCLAVLSLREEGPTANLLAPVVVNLASRVCVQAVVAGYSHQHPLCAENAAAAAAEEAAGEAMACS